MPGQNPPPRDLALELLRRFQQEGVAYVLVGGQAVRLTASCLPQKTWMCFSNAAVTTASA